jgi:hypothetical protein
VEILPFIQVIIVVVQEFYLQSSFHAFSEPLIETSHVYFIPFYVGETLFVDEEFADAAEFPIIVPKFGPAFYSILSLHVN